MEGKSSKVVGVKGGNVIDVDIDKALAMERKFDEKLYNIAIALSY